MTDHQPPVRPERLAEIHALADAGMELAQDYLHLLRHWEASQDGLRNALSELTEARRELRRLSSARETLKYMPVIHDPVISEAMRSLEDEYCGSCGNLLEPDERHKSRIYQGYICDGCYDLEK